MGATQPSIRGVLETVLYFTDQDRTERFYSEVLGLRLLASEPGRSLFYRAGGSVLLLFNAEETLRPGGSLPAHGARGSVHACFVVDEDEYEGWKEYLRVQGVPIEHEARWPRGLSFYFRDPDGNLLEIADRDFWPR